MTPDQAFGIIGLTVCVCAAIAAAFVFGYRYGREDERDRHEAYWKERSKTL